MWKRWTEPESLVHAQPDMPETGLAEPLHDPDHPAIGNIGIRIDHKLNSWSFLIQPDKKQEEGVSILAGKTGNRDSLPADMDHNRRTLRPAHMCAGQLNPNRGGIMIRNSKIYQLKGRKE